MAFKILNRVRMSLLSAPGQGALAVNTAVPGFQTFTQAGAGNGDTTPYLIEDGTPLGTVWELGLGTWNTNGTLVRTAVSATSNGNTTAISASANAIVSATVRDVDFTPAAPTRSAPSVVQSTYVQQTSSGSITATLGSAPTAGNLLVAIGFGGGTTVSSTYSPGFYPNFFDRYQSWTLSNNYSIGYAMRVARASESATYTLGISYGSFAFGAVLLEIAGVDLTAISEFLMTQGAIVAGGSTTTLQVLSQANALTLAFAGGDTALSYSTPTAAINHSDGTTRVAMGYETSAGGYDSMSAIISTGTANGLVMSLPGSLIA